MTDDTRTNFLGIPIRGEKRAGATRVNQLPREDFEAIVAKILADEFFVDFGWTQYTPYFNDGDPCEFGASDFWIRTIGDIKLPTGPLTFGDPNGDEDEEGSYDWMERFGVSYSHPTLGDFKWNGKYGNESAYIYSGDHEDKWNLARTLYSAVEGGSFENVLLDLFGDHCRVRVTRNGITIDEYSHD